jgi:hypothetical protein
MPSEPFIEDDMAVTLWPYVAHEKADYDDDDKLCVAAHALRRRHNTLADYPGALPSYAGRVEECAALLRCQAALPSLAANDRAFLMWPYERLRDSLAVLPARLLPIHGAAHLGNVFFTASGPL